MSKNKTVNRIEIEMESDSDSDFYEGNSDTESTSSGVISESAIANDTTEFTRLMFDRFCDGKKDFNILLVGKVSSGKTTLLNAILGDMYSDTKVQKITSAVTLYLTNSTSDVKSRNEIFEMNKKVNSEGKFTFQRFNLDYKINEQDICINLIDTPGIDDVHMDDDLYNWMTNNRDMIDLFLIVIDIKESFNTKSNSENIKKLTKHCKSNIMFIINKIDEVDDEEKIELYEKCEKNIKEVMKDKEYEMCGVSSLIEYYNRMAEANKSSNLSLKKGVECVNHDSNFVDLYKCINEALNKSNTERKILRFIDDDIVDSCEKLDKLYNSLSTLQKLCLDDKQRDFMAKKIYGVYKEDAVTDILNKHDNINKELGLSSKIKELFIEDLINNTENDISSLTNLIKKFTDSKDKNTLLKTYFDKLTKDAESKKLFKSNKNHYEFLVECGKLVNSEDDHVKSILESYINLIVVTNLECTTSSISLGCKKYCNKKGAGKLLLRTLIYLLLETDDSYKQLFKKYKNLYKLRYIDGNDSVNISSSILLDLNFDELDKNCEYLKIIKDLDSCISYQLF